MATFTVKAVGHPTVFTYPNRTDAGIHARILESVGYTVVMRETLASVTSWSDRAIVLLEDDMRDHESF